MNASHRLSAVNSAPTSAADRDAGAAQLSLLPASEISESRGRAIIRCLRENFCMVLPKFADISIMAPPSQHLALQALYFLQFSLEVLLPPPDPNVQLAVFNRNNPFRRTDRQLKFFKLNDNSPTPDSQAPDAQRSTLGFQDDDSHLNTSLGFSYMLHHTRKYVGNFKKQL